MTYALRALTGAPCLADGDSGAERLRFSKQLALVIYLAARPGARASREELLGLLWCGAPVFDARQALRQVVYQIRHNTDSDLLRGDEVLSLRPGAVEFDVEAFRTHVAEGRLEYALGVYEADFLATVGLSGASEFEHWAEGLRQQLAAERRQILRTLMARRADAGKWHEAACFAEQLADADPENLEPRLRRIELLAAAGDAVRAAAGAEEVRRLAAEREGQRQLADVEQAISRALSAGTLPERRAANGFPRHPEMVGRATEFRRVVDAWKRALEGRGGAVLVTGEAGVGKTRLVREIERRFQQDRGLVVHVACHAVEQSDQFAPFLEALRDVRAAPGLAGASPACLEVLAALVPEIAERFAASVSPRQLPIAPQAVASSLADALAAVADDSPLTLVVEDLHWAPAGTAEFAHRLARRAAATRLLLVLTAREFGGSPANAKAVRNLSASDAVKEVSLGALDGPEVEQLIASMAQLPPGESGGALARRIHQATDGIPLYVLEVLKTLHDGGALGVKDATWQIAPELCDTARPLPVPRSSGAILGARLGALGDGPTAVLAALAVAGRASSAGDVVRIAGLPEEAVCTALATLERRRLVGHALGVPDAWRVVHDELAAVALSVAPPAFVELYHARAADIAEERAATVKPSDWAVAAWHAARAGDVIRAGVAAARAVAEIETVSGVEAGRGALETLLEALPVVARGEVSGLLRRVSNGEWTARRWLEERDGTRRRRRVRYAAAAVAGLAVVGAVTAGLSLARRPPPPLGGGYIALGYPGSVGREGVVALRLDSALGAHRVSADSLPRGLRVGAPSRNVRPDDAAAAVTCTLPNTDAVAICAVDLLTGDTTMLGRSESDAHLLDWLPDGSGFLMSAGRVLGDTGYASDIVLADSAGGAVATLLGGGGQWNAARVSPRGDRFLTQVLGAEARGVKLFGIEGEELGVVEWCRGPVSWSPTGDRLACLSQDRRGIAVGEARVGAAATVYPLPGPPGEPVWSPNGRWIAVTTLDPSGSALYLLDARGATAPQPVASFDRSLDVLGWAPSVMPRPPQRVVAAVRSLSLTAGERGAIGATARDHSGRAAPAPVYLRWRVEDSTVARVDSAGNVTADRPGNTRVYAVTGLRERDTVVVEVRPPARRELLREDFESGLDTNLWRPWGYPAPRVLDRCGRGGSRGFHNNGDYSHSSGIACRRPVDLTRGLTVEYWGLVPTLRGRWKQLTAALSSLPADSFRLGRGNPVAGSEAGLGAKAPTVEAPDSPTLETYTAQGSIIGPWPRRLSDGAWHRYRLVLYPHGEARVFADGIELTQPVRFDPSRLRSATLLLHGRPMGTLVMLDDVTVWEGVVLDPAAPAPARRAGRSAAGAPGRRAP